MMLKTKRVQPWPLRKYVAFSQIYILERYRESLKAFNSNTFEQTTYLIVYEVVVMWYYLGSQVLVGYDILYFLLFGF